MVRIVIACLFILIACNIGEVNSSAYIQYVEDRKNGLNVEIKTEKYLFSLQYKPLEYVTLIELHNIYQDNHFSRAQFEEAKKKFEGVDFFTFGIKNLKNEGEIIKSLARDSSHSEALFNYFNFQMQNDITLLNGKDTLKCVLFHYEHNYGISPMNKFLLGFKQINKVGDLILQYDDITLNTGQLNFNIRKEDLEKIPAVKI